MIFKNTSENATYENHINLLGYFAKDKVTGFFGTIDSVCFDLYGCIQCYLRPKVTADGKIQDGHWFDVTRLSIDTTYRVVAMQNFYEGYVAEGEKGAAEKTRS